MSDKLIVVQPLNKFLFTEETMSLLCLPEAVTVPSSKMHYRTAFRCMLTHLLILFSQLRLGLQTSLTLSGFPFKILYAFLIPPYIRCLLSIPSSLILH
jgi:hypothetical protein